MRKFKTKATRDSDDGKINYAHISAIADRMYCEYMHSNRIQKNGKLRAADNYKLGMPFKVFLKSFNGHLQDLKLLLEGVEVMEGKKQLTFFDAIMGIRFNLDGLMMETMRGKKLERKYTDGELKYEFNKSFKKLK